MLAPQTVGSYFETWTSRHPRPERTNGTNRHRIERVLDCELDGRPLREWPYLELRRRQTLELVDELLAGQGRAVTGPNGIIRSLSAMTEDAITDEVAEINAFKGVTIRANDPRAKNKPRGSARLVV